MNITKKQIRYNKKARTGKISYIVIHDTGNQSRGADADAHFQYFDSGNRNSSADFFVDDEKILQVNDYTKYYTYHVGDGKGKYGITNQNSVGIEICVNAGGNYQKAYQNAVDLTKYLMQQLGIDAKHVVRHFDASKKRCPASMAANDWAYWQDFQNRIREEITMKECNFKDIAQHYAKEHIKALYRMGIVNGKDESHFCPNEPISRADAAIMIRNAIRYITGS